MRKDDLKPDKLDKALKELDFFEPSMRFSKNVLEQVKAETGLIQPERGALYWIPRVCILSVVLVLLLITVILTGSGASFEISFTEQTRQILYAAIGTLTGVSAYILMDRFVKRLLIK